jgi:hypothetical protein
MTRIRTRTYIGAVAFRIFAKNQADIANALEVQKGFRIMPLSAYLQKGMSYEAPKSAILPEFTNEAPQALRAFENLGRSMQDSLPISADHDDAMVSAFAQIGLSVAGGFEWQTLDDAVKRGLERAALAGEKIIDSRWMQMGEMTNGWRYVLAGGRAGHDFVLRATLAKYLIGAQLAEQVIYPNCQVDADGAVFDGMNEYVLHFEKGHLPPVQVFWNLSMYAADMLFIENTFKRYSLGSTTDGLKANADGSMTLYLQHTRPAEGKVSNWLPAPAGRFNLTMRLYGPLTPLLDGSYRLPGVERVK